MQHYIAQIEKIKRLRPDLSAFQTLVAICQSHIDECGHGLWPKTIPTHRDCRPLYFYAPEFRDIDQLLDVGGGPGFVASLLKEENPQLKITVFDFPAVCDHALDIFRESDQSHDLGAHPGDFLVDPFPSGFHTIQFSCVLECFPPAIALMLLEKTHQALPKQGKVLIYGDTRKRYAIHQYLAWLDAAGFSQQSWRCDTDGNVLMTAVK